MQSSIFLFLLFSGVTFAQIIFKSPPDDDYSNEKAIENHYDESDEVVARGEWGELYLTIFAKIFIHSSNEFPDDIRDRLEEFEISQCAKRYISLMQDVEDYMTTFIEQVTYCTHCFLLPHLTFLHRCKICDVPKEGRITEAERDELCKWSNQARQTAQINTLEDTTYAFQRDCEAIVDKYPNRKEFQICWQCNKWNVTTTPKPTEPTTKPTLPPRPPSTTLPPRPPPCVEGSTMECLRDNRAYYVCINGMWKYEKCPEGERFKNAGAPVWITNPNHCVCLHGWNRALKNSTDERKYETCLTDHWIERTCPNGTKYDNNFKICVEKF